MRVASADAVIYQFQEILLVHWDDPEGWNGEGGPGCRPDIYGWTQPASVCVIKALGEVLFLLQRKRKVCRIQRESL